jgi:hypothetical protein
MKVPPYLLDYRDNVDPCRAGLGTAAAPDTARPAVFRDEAPLLVIETELDARGTRITEILAACNERVGSEETGVPRADSAPAAAAELQFVVNVEAVTGWADGAAGTA